ncbi:MAG: site-specific integrase [Clostridia bacterium]|nr:site-specific integrase [Clostridia bacterium]
MNYGKWLEHWLEFYVKPAAKQSTLKKYLTQCRLHIEPLLGKYQIDDVSVYILQQFASRLLQKGLAPNTVNSIVSTVKHSLRQAYVIGVTQKENTHAIMRTKVREKKAHCFSVQTQKRIETYVLNSKKPKFCGILLSLYTGIRVGELLALKWQDIDFEKGIINITKSCRDSWQDGKYIKIIDTAKTHNSMRVIPMPRQIVAYLKKIKRRIKGDYVVMGRTEQGAEMRTYQRTFEQLLRKLAIPHCGIHTLQHTFATRALEIGMDVKTLAEILGHSDPTVTLKRYAHSMLEYKTEIMNKLGKMVFDKK